MLSEKRPHDQRPCAPAHRLHGRSHRGPTGLPAALEGAGQRGDPGNGLHTLWPRGPRNVQSVGIDR
jgi:hypothetical protein